MTVAEIKEYAQTIADYIKNYREVCREENTNEELIPTTPLQNDIEHLVSMLDELEPNTISQAIKIIENEEEKLKFDLDKHRVDNCIFELKNILGLAIYKDELTENNKWYH